MYYRFLEEVDPEERMKVYNELAVGSKPTFDFFLMVVLASIIATFGLITNSVAVIIGGMLVAPLMLPILAISLAMILGDLELFSRSVEAEIKGILLAISASLLLVLIVPNFTITPEIEARVQPTLFDLIVALASGAAAAYAHSRPNLSPSLTGVAIATAIIPPLSVVGIGLAIKRWDIAGGGFLLFIANLIAINAASSVVFWVLGFGPRWSQLKEREVVKRLLTSGALLLLVSIPLAWIMLTGITETNTKTTIRKVITHQIEGIEGSELVGFTYEHRNNIMKISATVNSPKEFSQERVEEIKNALEKNLKRPIDLSLKVVVTKIINANHSGEYGG